ncbi:hypothetical protein GPJ56_001707 [Histomonas meleagridis]|uniref:uncharacterized protein n=1 Tax=Histomonas meleagridis TaxID=135588 RepID=UPI0035598674|nr:hypothetical protein GPJ56_001707 [Histomonas meleagridis]KAH0796207.1 hypothetical protein GO595_010100 [Histomonas meleagridis]
MLSAADFEIALQELVQQNLSPNDIYLVLKALEFDLDNLTYSDLDMEFVSSCLHKLFRHHAIYIKSSVLRFCCTLETMAPTSITEKYHFDYLIAESLNKKPPVPAPRIDEEKVCCFQYILVLLRYRKHIPIPVQRAMISLYSIPNNTYKSLIIGYLCEATTVCDSILQIEQISHIIVDHICETGSQEVASLISFSIEKRNHLITDDSSLSPLLSIFSQPPDTKDTQYSGSMTALTYLLRTWPGFFYFGINHHAIADLILCLPHDPDNVIDILRNLLKLSGGPSCVTDPYCGLLLSILLRHDLIEKLSVIAATNSSASSLLNELLPFTSKINIVPKETDEIIESKPTNLLLLDLAQAMQPEHQITTINGYTLHQDPQKWDWTTILLLLVIVLPHNDQEAQSATAKNLYLRLLQFFGGQFLSTTHGKCSIMDEPLIALVQLLISKNWGIQIIETNAEIKQGMLQTLEMIRDNVSLDKPSPHLTLFKCIASLMAESNGISILNRWGFHEIITSMGRKCNSAKNCQMVLELVNLYPETSLVTPMYLNFLASENNEVHLVAIEELRKKRLITPNFQINGFCGILIPHIKELAANHINDRLQIAMNFFGEIVSSDEHSLLTISNDKQLHEVLCNNSRFIYSLLLSKEEALQCCPSIDNEIKWWMDTGNLMYLQVYDKAVKYTFSGDLSVTNTKQSAIFNFGGYTKVPPHLFQQLSHVEVGRQKLEKTIPTLLKKITSEHIRERRAAFFALAHFASVPENLPVVESNDIAGKLIKSALSRSSFVLEGTLIASLSLFAQSPYLSNVLQKYNWELFRFGPHQCVIPSDPLNFHKRSLPKMMALPTIPPISGYDEIASWLRNLSNSLLVKRTSGELIKAYKAKRSEIFESELALYAHTLIGKLDYVNEAREVIYYVFRDTSIMSLVPKQFDDAEINAIKMKIGYIVNKKIVKVPFSEVKID